MVEAPSCPCTKVWKCATWLSCNCGKIRSKVPVQLTRCLYVTLSGPGLHLIRFMIACSNKDREEECSEFETVKPLNRLPMCVNMNCFADDELRILLLVAKNNLWRSVAVVYS